MRQQGRKQPASGGKTGGEKSGAGSSAEAVPEVAREAVRRQRGKRFPEAVRGKVADGFLSGQAVVDDYADVSGKTWQPRRQRPDRAEPTAPDLSRACMQHWNQSAAHIVGTAECGYAVSLSEISRALCHGGASASVRTTH